MAADVAGHYSLGLREEKKQFCSHILYWQARMKHDFPIRFLSRSKNVNIKLRGLNIFDNMIKHKTEHYMNGGFERAWGEITVLARIALESKSEFR
jgi:hypothetical protein